MARRFWSAIPILTLCVAFGVGTTSCGGGGGGTNPDLVLLGFNQPNVAGVALNQPLIFTFSADIDPVSITPDTLRVVGAFGPFFERTHVDGELVALLPRAPNFGTLSDVGLAPNTTYSISMPTFPAVDTIESTGGKPLLTASTYTFKTVPGAPFFIESRRELVHGPSPLQGGRSDDLGCLQNPGNSLFVNPCVGNTCFEVGAATCSGATSYVSNPPAPADPLPQQSNSGCGGRLLCLQNEGQPHVVREQCQPLHDQRAVGTPAAGSQNIGRVSLSALVLAFNEQIDPSTVAPYNTATKLATNVQLWRVALLDGTPLSPPEPIQTNEPSVVQSLDSTQVLLVASGPVLQGIYMINLTGNIRDLAQNTLFTADRPSLTGQIYQGIDAGLGPTVPPGWRLYFQTLQIAGAASAISESFGSNLAEHGDLLSTNVEPGVFTQSVTTTNPLAAMTPSVINAPMSTPSFTLLFGPGAPTIPPTSALQCGQTTTANWNNTPADLTNTVGNGFRFLNLSSLEANVDADSGAGRLKAVYKPYHGSGGDGAFDSNAGLFNPGPGDNVTLTTTPGAGASANGDGIYEYSSFWLQAGDTLTVTGVRPLLILCRGAFQVDGTIELSGQNGGFGADTDNTGDYTNAGAIPSYGAGGLPGPGGGAGGRGAGPGIAAQANALPGSFVNDVFGVHTGTAPVNQGLGGATPQSGGGGGFSTNGQPGTDSSLASATNGHPAFGGAYFERPLSQFTPDRGYSPNADITGGAGGGGGGIKDTDGSGTVTIGDHGSGGGGGGGGAIWVIAGGQIRVGPTGVIRANGGAGGSTYNKANQRINPGADASFGGGDDYYEGLKAGAVVSGAGGAGGGGAGGAILLIGEGGVNLQASATLQALGGAGGEAGSPGSGYAGGAGSPGFITLMGMGGPGVTVAGASVAPAATTHTWNPTVKNASVGQSQWIDLFTSTVNFNPVIGSPQVPFQTDNFSALVTAGQPRGPAANWDAVWEFQGADTLSTPLPGAGTPTVATGLTQWSTNIDLCDTKRYFRYRWRFFVSDAFPAEGLSALPLPAVLDCTIPFVK